MAFEYPSPTAGLDATAALEAAEIVQPVASSRRQCDAFCYGHEAHVLTLGELGSLTPVQICASFGMNTGEMARSMESVKIHSSRFFAKFAEATNPGWTSFTTDPL